jgi:SAM-dependent methyltransferase
MDNPKIPTGLKSRLGTAYNAIAPKYNQTFTTPDDPIRLGYLTRLLTLLQASSQPQAKVLELGCGAGIPVTATLLSTTSPEFHVTANDLSSAQIALAREHLSGYEEEGRLVLKEGDMMDLKFVEGTLDAVVGFYSIIHLPRGEQTEIVGRCAKWLRKGGLLLVNFSKEEVESRVEPGWLGEEDGWMVSAPVCVRS